MLAWSTFSLRQKVGAIFIALLFLLASPLLVISIKSLGELLTILGGLCCGVAVMLNPASFFRSAGSIVDARQMPRVCWWLGLFGLFGVFSGIVLNFFWK